MANIEALGERIDPPKIETPPTIPITERILDPILPKGKPINNVKINPPLIHKSRNTLPDDFVPQAEPKFFDEEDLKLIKLNSKLALARKSFYYFCKLLMPTAFTKDKPYLRKYCDVLQAAYEGRLVKKKLFDNDGNQIPNPAPFEIRDALPDDIVCKNLMINMPPQHYKSRTLTLFCSWVLGRNPKGDHILSVSYNQDVATTFSKYTRDTIDTKKMGSDIVFSDIFPDCKLNPRDKSSEFWCVVGSYFSYAAAGMGGSITGKGPTIRIIDDPIKGDEEALNEIELDRHWTWYQGTFLSRKDATVEEALTIINMTRWVEDDLCGRIMKAPDAHKWHIVLFKAYDEATGQMLCESVLTRELYLSMEKGKVSDIDRMLFYANYNQETYSVSGALYKNLKRYRIPPNDYTSIKMKVDTADTGKDYLCSIVYLRRDNVAYIVDVVYTQQPQPDTLPLLVYQIMECNVNYSDFEGNKDGAAFMRLVEKELQLKGWFKTIFGAPKSFDNKQARIRQNASTVINQIYFPEDAEQRWPMFMQHVKRFQMTGKNKYDDAPDTLTMVALDIDISRQAYQCDIVEE